MLNDAEQKLLNANVQGFPMIKAASAALQRCGTCGHGNINVHAILNTAATKYRNDPAFIALCKSLVPLPCTIGGILIK